MKLSIIIPVFNEEKTILKVLERLFEVPLGVTKEIIVVDDGSSDKTDRKILNSRFSKKIKFLRHNANLGKGKALQTGLKNASGDYVLIQDADLEYNPKDIEKLLKPIEQKKSKVVYGTRLNRLPNLQRDERNFQFLTHYFGNRFLSFLISVLYLTWLTDIETGYKVFPREALKKFKLRSRRFDFEPEITSKLLKRGYKIIEIPIQTNPRSYSEGKKLNTLKDGTIALLSIFRYRFID